MRFGSGLGRTAGIVVVACLVVTSCAGAPETPTAGEFDDVIDIGGGREMFLDCDGEGSPTVVLVSGNGNGADVWRYANAAEGSGEPPGKSDTAVYPTTAETTHVCSYDRPGTLEQGGSENGSTPVEQPTTSQQDVEDLHALLTSAGIPGPYVLVGHSRGGMTSLMYARTYPQDVSGLVLVDAFSPFLPSTLTPAEWTSVYAAMLGAWNSREGAEVFDIDSSITALDALPPLPASIPVVVISADQPVEFPGVNDFWSKNLAAQEELATSLNAPHITDTSSGHDVYIENPGVVNQQICSILTPGAAC
jgi:pimeloyl-ACP methyl ester carboxylesterase